MNSIIVAGQFGALKAYLSTFNFLDFLSMIARGIAMISSFMMMFGEEFGWRGFLQPRLQNKFGKRMGVILLGLIWGLWHVNMYFFILEPDYIVNATLNQLIGCVYLAILFAYIYEKSGSIWGTYFILLCLFSQNQKVLCTGGE